ncbi:MAG TPA: CatA-like O-acetyltransferase [Vicinamibacterales bacterium]|nr:CatA-like O-acetyltransferase [Vicinamibacterales bacterium]
MSGLIDLRTWKRRGHYLWFRKYERPFFSVTVEVDVTAAWNRARRRGAPSFFLTSLFSMLRAANDVEAFRLRLRPRGVWRHDRVAVGPTIMRADETFGFVRLETADTLSAFAARAQPAIAQAAEQTGLRSPKNSPDDIVFHSVLPWLRFTSFTNALPGSSDSIPRVVFGRRARDRRRMTMPVAVEVHHALVDGLDVARFFDRFAAHLNGAS